MGIPRKIQTLNSVKDLSGVTFGHEFPRHGLKLLYWLANELIEFNPEIQMLARTDPRTREFGFHIFHNLEDILPELPGDHSCYYMVGNLNADGAEDLPFRQADTGSDESNTDRIIVRMDSYHVINEVYITEHTPHHNSFCFDSTYRISRGLIQHIQNLEEGDFLQKAGYVPRKSESPRSESREIAVNIEMKSDSLRPAYVLGKSPRSKSRETAVEMPWAGDFPGQSRSICDMCVIL